jgi:tetratricopeptide (TPR) repeat protein
MPTNVLFDCVNQMSINGSQLYFKNIFLDLDIIFRFLIQLKEKRNRLHFVFQSLMDFDSNIGKEIVLKYIDLCQNISQNNNINNNNNNNNSNNNINNCENNLNNNYLIIKPFNKLSKLKFGLLFGTFLRESGWYSLSKDILINAIQLYNENELSRDLNVLSLVFESKWKLLSVLNSFCCFEDANHVMKEIQLMIDCFDIKLKSNQFNLAQVYIEFAQLFFFQSYYNESYKWVIKSLQQLNRFTPILTVIDVYRQAAKTSVVKREFKRAETLINQAMIVCKETFGVREDQHKYTIGVIHLKLADLFLDYGFYLLNVDLISHSVKLYEMALEIREHIFGLKSNEVNNLLIAMNHEELGYACYVQEYSSGNFLKADYHANKAMSIVTQLLPQNHLLLASAKRVKALILEEIAIDSHDKQEIERMLSQSEILHISALDMARQAFGEMNVQTAKHYGNLGRLYQSMKRYTEAEAMHLKAIQIKEQLLGRNDYEVALSLGHLASLYNYDMHMFEKAEELYLRSIDIGINLFGVGYSGLEYDYRGLCRVYSHLRDSDKLYHFINKLHNWKHLRDSITRSVKDSPPIKDLETIQKLSPQQIISLIENLSN